MFNKYMAVGIKVKNFKKAFDFYTKVLGFEEKILDLKNEFAEVRLGELVIALLTKTTLDGMCGSGNFSENSKPNNIFAMEVNNVSDTYKKLIEKNVEFI